MEDEAADAAAAAAFFSSSFLAFCRCFFNFFFSAALNPDPSTPSMFSPSSTSFSSGCAFSCGSIPHAATGHTEAHAAVLMTQDILLEARQFLSESIGRNLIPLLQISFGWCSLVNIVRLPPPPPVDEPISPPDRFCLISSFAHSLYDDKKTNVVSIFRHDPGLIARRICSAYCMRPCDNPLEVVGTYPACGKRLVVIIDEPEARPDYYAFLNAVVSVPCLVILSRHYLAGQSARTPGFGRGLYSADGLRDSTLRGDTRPLQSQESPHQHCVWRSAPWWRK